MAFPALLLIAVWILGVVYGSSGVKTDLVNAIMNALPLEAVQGERQISNLLAGLTDGAGGLGLFTIVTLVYSGSGAVGAVRQAVESASPDGAPGRRFPGSRLFDMGITAVTMPVLLLVVGAALSSNVSTFLDHRPVLAFTSPLSGGGTLLFVLTSLLLAWLYWIQDRNPQTRTWSSALIGGTVSAMLCSLVWVGLQTWFSLTGGGAAVYGVLAGFLGLLLFLNLACLAVVYGAHLAASFREYRSRLG